MRQSKIWRFATIGQEIDQLLFIVDVFIGYFYCCYQFLEVPR